VAQSLRSAADPNTLWLVPSSPSLWAPPTETGVGGVLALIDELKAMLAKMVVAEEAKRAALPAALPSSPSLDALRSPIALLSTPTSGHL
jgi:hypothetical protein